MEEDEEGRPEEGDRVEEGGSGRAAAGWKGDTKMEVERRKEK